MVCKKYQVYDWFRTLDGAKRIDFLNGMLHLCFPLELRFLGSCIEELARKDYSYLRDAEYKANNPPEITNMRDISNKVTRSKMIVTLALLGSNNFECARLLYELLNVNINDLLDKMQVSLDEKVADEFLLLLTMAANHPAFDFQMKTRMSQLYLCAESKLKLTKIIIAKESETDMCLFSSTSTTGTAAEYETSNETTADSTNQNKIYSNNSTKIDKPKNLTASDSISPVRIAEKKTNKALLNNSNSMMVIKSDGTSITGNEIIETSVDDNNNNKQRSHSTSFIANKNSDNINNLNENNLFFKDLINRNKTSQSNISCKNSNNGDEVIDSIKIEKSKDDQLSSEKKSLIESINFEGVQTIKGTENYKFIIKVLITYYFKIIHL